MGVIGASVLRAVNATGDFRSRKENPSWNDLHSPYDYWKIPDYIKENHELIMLLWHLIVRKGVQPIGIHHLSVPSFRTDISDSECPICGSKKNLIIYSDEYVWCLKCIGKFDGYEIDALF
jgi:hypothetical protein